MRSLEELRNELDRIDPQIIQLYEERMSVCEEVGEIKIEEGRKVFDRNREQQKLAQVTREAKDPFYKKGLTELFEQLMSQSRKLQYQLLTKAGSARKTSVYRSGRVGLEEFPGGIPGDRWSILTGCNA